MEVNQENAIKIAKWYHQEVTNLFDVVYNLSNIIKKLDIKNAYNEALDMAKNKINRIQNIQNMQDYNILLT